MRSHWIAVFLLLALTGCFTQQDAPETAMPEYRPEYQPSQVAGGAFEGPIRHFTQGMEGDVLGCDEAPLGDMLVFSCNNNQRQPKLYTISIKAGVPQRPQQITFGQWPDVDPAFLPTLTPGKYKIAFASRIEDNFDIYMKSFTGNAGLIQVTASKADERHPSFSPNSPYLAFCRLDGRGTWHIWKKNLETQRETLLGPGMNPAWSPTGERIAFQLPVGRERSLYSVWTMNVDGGERTQVVAYTDRRFGATHPDWSTTGRYLVYSKIARVTSPPGEGAPPTGVLCAIELATGMTLKLTTLKESLDTMPCWGLDDSIYFSSTRLTGRFNLISRTFKGGHFQPPKAPRNTMQDRSQLSERDL